MEDRRESEGERGFTTKAQREQRKRSSFLRREVIVRTENNAE
jgi:hypothetical protein